MEHFSTMIAGFLAIVTLIFMPVMNVALQADNVSQNVIDNAVQEFVDDSRSSGKITAHEYEKMMDSINRAQPLCDIHITCGHKKYVPDVSGTVMDYHDENGETVILDSLYTDSGETSDYLLKKGDYLHVTVKNTTPSNGMKILSLFIPSSKSATTIYTTYGGYVEEDGLLNMRP